MTRNQDRITSSNVESVSSHFREWGSAILSDAMGTCGKSFQAMDAGIRPLAPEMKIAGPAFTVRCYPGATWALENAIEKASPGDVLVVDGGSYPDSILMGSMMSTRAQQRGLAGAIVDGAVRDIEEVLKLGFPVFTRHICPRAGTFAEIGELQTTVCCGRLPIQPGDWIVADVTGVAVIPVAIMDEVINEAEKIYRKEQSMAKHLKAGLNLQESSERARGE